MSAVPETRRAVGVALLVAFLALLAAPAFAEPPGTPPAHAEETARSPGEVDEWLLEGESSLAALVVLRGGAILLGIVFLVRELLRRDKVRGGMLPPPPRVEPTTPFSIGMALLLALVGLVGGPLVVAILAHASRSDALKTFDAQILATAASSVPVACLIVLRRWRLGSGETATVDARVADAFEVDVPQASRGPGPARAAFEGFRAYCLATLFLIPIGLLWVFVMRTLGFEMPVQDVVERFARPAQPWHPALLAVFGTLVAPFTEEAIFRGTLYPAVRRMAGGGRRGAWIGAVTVSAVFALIHDNLFAFPLLFALSLFMTWVFERTNSLLACFVCHALNNAATILPVLLRLYA